MSAISAVETAIRERTSPAARRGLPARGPCLVGRCVGLPEGVALRPRQEVLPRGPRRVRDVIPGIIALQEREAAEPRHAMQAPLACAPRLPELRAPSFIYL